MMHRLIIVLITSLKPANRINKLIMHSSTERIIQFPSVFIELFLTVVKRVSTIRKAIGELVLFLHVFVTETTCVEGRGSCAGEIVTVSRGGTLIVEIEAAAVDTSGTGPVCGVGAVDGEVGLDALEGVHVWSPFDEGEAVKHGKNADIDAIVL